MLPSDKRPEAQDTQVADATLARLRWRCRRGTRELDALMLGWLQHHYPSAGESERRAFCDMLDMQDPDLMKLIISGDHQDQAESAQSTIHTTVLEQIRHSDSTGT